MGHLVYLIQITLVTLLVADDEDVGERYDVAVHVDVGRILHTSHTVDIKGVAVHLRGEFAGGVAPYTVLALYELGHARGFHLAKALHLHLLGGQEVACHFHFYSLRGKEVECHCAVLVDDG